MRRAVSTISFARPKAKIHGNYPLGGGGRLQQLPVRVLQQVDDAIEERQRAGAVVQLWWSAASTRPICAAAPGRPARRAGTVSRMLPIAENGRLRRVDDGAWLKRRNEKRTKTRTTFFVTVGVC